jgi:hypothetical protein
MRAGPVAAERLIEEVPLAHRRPRFGFTGGSAVTRCDRPGRSGHPSTRPPVRLKKFKKSKELVPARAHEVLWCVPAQEQ